MVSQDLRIRRALDLDVARIPPDRGEEVIAEAERTGDDEVVSTVGTWPVSKRDLATVYRPTEWLNDVAVNTTRKIIVEKLNILRPQEWATPEPLSGCPVPRGAFVDSLTTSLWRDEIQNRAPPTGTAQQSRALPAGMRTLAAFLRAHFILIPFNNNRHWKLGGISPTLQKVEIMDSLGGNPQLKLELMYKFSEHLLGDAYIAEE